MKSIKSILSLDSDFSTIMLVGALAVGLAATSGTAFAGNKKVYPGSSCISSREDATDTNLLRGGGSSIKHQRSGFSAVECPIVREQVKKKAGFKALVRVKGEVKCAIRSFDEAGKKVIAVDAKASPINAGDEELSMQVGESVANGPYTLGCSIGSFASIFKYTITELK